MAEITSQSVELQPEQRRSLREQVVDGMRTERYQHILNIARLEGIPQTLRDGSEDAAIHASVYKVAVLDAQINALLSLDEVNGR